MVATQICAHGRWGKNLVYMMIAWLRDSNYRCHFTSSFSPFETHKLEPKLLVSQFVVSELILS